MKKDNIIGKKFGRLTILEEMKIKNKYYYKCICDCSNIKIIRKDHLLNNGTKSCGCLQNEIRRKERMNISGKKFGYLTVLKRLQLKTKGGDYYYECECDCGNKVKIIGQSLKAGVTKSCGCYYKNKQNLSGLIFGKLIVIEKIERKNKFGNYYYRCKCSCGKNVEIIGSSLTTGNTKSCGCVDYIDLTGKTFGKLTVIKKSEIKKNKNIAWECICKCGNKKIIETGHLTSGSTKSCGCQISRGNDRINIVLASMNIDFKKEKTFDKCKDKAKLRFDFYLPNYNLCIEFQGVQHYKTGIWGKKTERQEMLEKIQKHDQIKRDYCLQNNIELLEISYKDFNNIEEILKSKLLKE